MIVATGTHEQISRIAASLLEDMPTATLVRQCDESGIWTLLDETPADAFL